MNFLIIQCIQHEKQIINTVNQVITTNNKTTVAGYIYFCFFLYHTNVSVFATAQHIIYNLHLHFFCFTNYTTIQQNTFSKPQLNIITFSFVFIKIIESNTLHLL